MRINKLVFGVLTLAILAMVFQACTGNSSQTLSTQNSAFENIMTRTSVRTYLDKDVEESKIDLLLKAAMAAPTGYNSRPWHFVVVKDRATLDKIGDHANDSRQAIVVCGDTTLSKTWFLDCAAAGENILLAAHSLGLGAVWTSGYTDDKRVALIREAIALPPTIMPLCVIVFGYPQPGPMSAKDKFNPARIHRDRY